MIFFFEVPIIVILVLIALFIGGVYLVVNNIIQIIFSILLVIIDIGIYIFLCKIFYKIYKKNENKWFFVSFISITIYWFFGILFFIGLKELDKNNVYMSIFGESDIIRYLIMPLVIILFVSIALLIIAYFSKQKVLQSLICIVSAIFVFVFMTSSADICTKSYSDCMVQEFANRTDKIKCIANSEAKLYYPAFGDGSKEFIALPMFSPIKYSTESFKKGDVIYIENTRIKSPFGTEFVKASDGKKIGYIKTETLK